MNPWHPETADRPFNDLPHLPPAVDLETQPVLKQCIAARAALAELKQATELFPNPAMLINTLPLLEAKASSEIENIVTTADRIFRHLSATGPTDVATKEALRYRHALLEAYGTLSERPVTTRTAEEICSRIKGTDMWIRRVPGMALANDATGEVIYTPPESETRIRDLLTNWERFLHGAEDHDTGDPPPAPPLDPLVRMAVAHYQFEAIHPFTDGNGRTGRVLNSLFLVEQGLLPLPILYLSRYIIAHKADYYRLLLDVTRRRRGSPGSSISSRASRRPPPGPTLRSSPSAPSPRRRPSASARSCPRSTAASSSTCSSNNRTSASRTSSTPGSRSARPPRST